MALPLLLNSKVGAGFVASSVGQISRPSKKMYQIHFSDLDARQTLGSSSGNSLLLNPKRKNQ
jgi:hypothetical protein